ncbi:MAG TPA: cytochrome c oxidase subunit 3 family protein [Tepidisphaeraceae bacterium]|jgi:cytochrome c oxidase subunit 3
MSQLTVFERDSLPSEQFEDIEQQRETSSLGMWTFLSTEVLFFGVLFTGFFVYRVRWPEAFAQGAHELKWYLGAINTAVLLGSSFCMALAVHAASEADNRAIVRWLWFTIALGTLFVLIKGTEYTIEWHDHLVPRFHWSSVPPGGGEARPPQVELFMTYYFVMTMLHALHMLIGLGVLATILVLAKRRHFTKEYHHPVEVVGLYWHFVDTVWVFLFPVLYLLRH